MELKLKKRIRTENSNLIEIEIVQLTQWLNACFLHLTNVFVGGLTLNQGKRFCEDMGITGGIQFFLAADFFSESMAIAKL